MSSHTEFLTGVAGGCFFTLLVMLFAHDIIRIMRYNREARANGKPRIALGLAHSWFFGVIALGFALTFFISAAMSALKLFAGLKLPH
ncbi:MAG: hypothetical protein HYV25_00075 [Candidatus Harrisonbacteria bacterium]|nr:hypothetical protein [Candidatus Harrisonbacteria bacterium]